MASIKIPAIPTGNGEKFACNSIVKGETRVERLNGRTKDILSSAGFEVIRRTSKLHRIAISWHATVTLEGIG